MAQTKVLLDTSSYFRLARSVRPLLGVEFGVDTRYCLCVLPELDEELRKSPRLQVKFHWASESEYLRNCAASTLIWRTHRKKAIMVFGYLNAHARAEGLGVSRADTLALAVAYSLRLEVVSDDKDMLALGQAFDIRTLTTLGLMKRMLDVGHLSLDRVREIARYWQYDNDTPGDFRGDFLRCFGELPPSPS